MKKLRFIPVLLVLTLFSAQLLPLASAAGSGSAILDGMRVEARSALLMDADNNEVLYEQDAREQCFPASITKVMTCLLAVEAVDRGELSLEQMVTVSANLYQGVGEGGSTQDIKTGETLTVKELLACALIPSANEACNALAETVAGDISTFLALMNQRAAELGMTGTHFANTHGYQDENHYTTAYDVYLMSGEAMKHPTFRELVGLKNYTVPATNLHDERVLRSTNALISTFRVPGFYYQYATGIKTGSTPEAGYCLVSSAEKDGRTLIAVIMGGKDFKNKDGTKNAINYFSESARLLDWGFKSFSRRTILDETALDITEVPITLSREANSVAVYPDGAIAATLPNDLDPSSFERNWKLTADTVEAPVEAGQVLGTITISHEGKTYGTLNLVALNGVSRSELLYRLDRIQKFFDQLWVKLLLVLILLAVAVLLVRRAFFRRRGSGRRKNTYSNRGNYSGGKRR